MAGNIQEIFKRALNLPPVERAELIEALYHSFDRKNRRRIDALWAVEAESRIDAYESGKISSDPAEAVFTRINRR